MTTVIHKRTIPSGFYYIFATDNARTLITVNVDFDEPPSLRQSWQDYQNIELELKKRDMGIWPLTFPRFRNDVLQRIAQHEKEVKNGI